MSAGDAGGGALGYQTYSIRPESGVPGTFQVAGICIPESCVYGYSR